ncbi:spermidine synthase [Candidatus Gracilibacteria bacterium]|nr:MAG: spermidine synthase [Candidatus Gracilibacteria bacterium]PIE85079.1 MAG: spermidine synthase [Candidatus Gracilibacteria bacterium]
MLLFFTLIIAICGILYQLLIGTMSSYLIGDSVRQFSFTIGFFMSGMGIGAYFTRFLEKNALYNFVRIELLLSIIGASSVIILKLAYIYLSMNHLSFQFIYFFLTIFIGSLVGVEIPMIAALYKELKIKTKSVISDIFTFDYIGGLLSALLFPLVLLPYLGLYNISIFVGMLNLMVGFLYLNYIRTKKIYLTKYYFIVLSIFLYFIFLIFISSKLENFYLKFYYKEPILQSYQTDYQNVVLTKRGKDFRMYINGNIQFLSLDENRYHEALVDWPIKYLKGKENLNVLVLGGGDGLAVRNLLNYNNVSNITLVELDPKIIEIAKNQRDMKALNKNSLNNSKVKIINTDAFKYIVETEEKFDFIIADFPDPRDVHTSKLYSKEFYISLHGALVKDGIFVTQSSNAFFATKAFWSIDKTINNIFGNSKAYHRYLPSFGDWGFVLAKKGKLQDLDICNQLGCDKFDEEYLGENKNVKENTLTKPVIIDYYLDGYSKYNL